MIPKPPTLEALPANSKLIAGFGTATILPDMDFETYSPAGFIWNDTRGRFAPPPGASKPGLNAVGVACYTEHPGAEVLSLAYNLKDGTGAKLWKPGLPPPVDLFAYLATGGLIEAHNCGFERWVWKNVCVAKYGWPPIAPQQWRCSAAKARAFALPGALEALGDVLKLTERKDKTGKQLLDKFTRPRNPTKGNEALRNVLTDNADSQAFYRYNLQDIKTEAEASSRTPDLLPDELDFWLCDQAINERGVHIDVETARKAIEIIEQAYRKYDAEMIELTDGLVTSVTQLPKLKAWVQSRGVNATSLSAEMLTELLANATLPPDVKRALQLRERVGSAAVKKLYKMLNQTTRAGRMHDLFIYHSARTGRAAGAELQPQNLPNSGPYVYTCAACAKHYGELDICPWCDHPTDELVCDSQATRRVEWNADAVEDALETIKTGSLECVEYFWGNAIDTVSGCIRGLITAAPGHDLICSDYKAIEAVVLAALAGEEWRLEVFRTHGMIYEMSASRITGVPFEEFVQHYETTGSHHTLRKTVGKTAELASGFQGWVGAWKQFGADAFFNDEEMKTAILAWRKASPKIVEFWGGQPSWRRNEYYGIEGAAIQAVMCPGTEFSYRGITYVLRGTSLYCRLLSGRYLTYHNPRLEANPERGGFQLSFEGWNTNPKNGPVRKWIRIPTFGGRLTENIVQATARDILAHAIVNLERAGYPIVLHVHDEIVAEMPEGRGSVEEFERIMATMPAWATDWPIKAAGGWRGKRYRK